MSTFDQTFLISQRQKLQELRVELRESLEGPPETDRDVGDFADKVNEMTEMSLTLSQKERIMTQLAEIDASINRIDKGKYGICEITGLAIGVERLVAMPTTRYSLEGQQKMESKKKKLQRYTPIERSEEDV